MSQKSPHKPGVQKGSDVQALADVFVRRAEFSSFVKLMDHIGDEVMLIDQAGRVVFVNQAVVQAWGYGHAEMVGRLITDIFLENQKRMSMAGWQREHLIPLRHSNKPASLVLERLTKAGHKQTVDASMVWLPHDSQGFVLFVARDMTKQQAIQQRLQEMADFYHLLSEEAGDPILITDKTGSITYANRAAEHFLKVAEHQLVSKNVEKFVYADSYPRLRDYYARARSARMKFTFEVDFLDAKGHPVPAEVTLSSMAKQGKIVAFHMIARDMSPRREIEQLVIESEKMQAIQYFMTGSAQELKGPLMGVFKSTQLLLEKYKNRDFEYMGYREFSDIMRILEHVNKQVKSCYEKTVRLEELNRRKLKIPKEYCFVPAVLDDILKIRDMEFRSGQIVCKCHVPQNIPVIAMGAIEFNQIITSLINNSIESMPGGGNLTIRGMFLKASQQVQIEVKDGGIGIPPEILSHIFEPFYTTKQRGIAKHAGLGLTVAYSLMKACKGKITVQSHRAEGTVVKLLFPIKKNSSLPLPT